jgi:hypothetical protein
MNVVTFHRQSRALIASQRLLLDAIEAMRCPDKEDFQELVAGAP